jgi:NADH:ubiquinone oxidoreductase subunit 5 (subunit L)/multisubunit Na+/H+ antiporter MnhA subunit
MVALGAERVVAPVGIWFEVDRYHFPWTLVADRLSVPFALFSSLLVGLVGAFSRRYMHLEPGYRRFYLLLAFFGAGVEVVVLAGTLELLFFGWEIVGLASALLIAFFHERIGPVEHGLRAFATYRVCDIGLLAAAVWLHHATGSAEVAASGATAVAWGGFTGPADAAQATLIGLLLLWASMGKSAQVPLGGWLPRAMEGPTPSSAIFYGAISIHLGAYLLLRAAPLLEQAPLFAAAVCVVGAATAMHATFVGRVQTDIKSALAYASMTQVGIIFVEIGLGFRYLPLAHLVGHAAVRSLQILRSPSLLHDHHHLEQAMGRQLPKTGGHLERLVPASFQPWLYRHALERGYFDAVLVDYVVRGFARVFGGLDRCDRLWSALLASGPRPRWSRQRREVQESS